MHKYKANWRDKVMKKILFLLIFAFICNNLYAQDNTFETYSSNSKEYNDYISIWGFDCILTGDTFFGKSNNKPHYIYSNACAQIYETKENDLKKVYSKFLASIDTGFGTALLEMLPKELPANNTKIQKDNVDISFNISQTTIQITFIKNKIDYNLIFMKKDGKTIVADFTFMNDRFSPIDISKAENVGENIKRLEIDGIPLGKNLHHMTTGLTIKNVYSKSEASIYELFILNTTDLTKAYNILRGYFNKIYAIEYGENYFPAYSPDKIQKINNLYKTDLDMDEIYFVIEKDHIKAYVASNIN